MVTLHMAAAGGGSAGTGGAVNPLAGMPIMSRTEARARMKGAIGKCVCQLKACRLALIFVPVQESLYLLILLSISSLHHSFLPARGSCILTMQTVQSTSAV